MQPSASVPDFCDYLARHDLLPMEVLADLRRGMMPPQVGKILLDRRLLDVRQVMQIVALQADEPKMRFGELAIREGFIDERDLGAALRDQRLMRRHPAELILERGLMDHGDLLRALVGYTQVLESELRDGDGGARRPARPAPAQGPPA